jgi:hypothetical protein
MFSDSAIIACLLASSSDNSAGLMMQPITAKSDVGINGAQEEEA